MLDTTGILKDPVLRYDEDYNYLRDAGRQYIEELGSALWTDYNEHDPGITILEALCYAITELGYRTSFPIKDLLTQTDGTIPSSQTFFTAKNILTQSPLNKDDYRKLLIDIEGVQNAWLFSKSHYKDDSGKINAVGEIPVYADCKNDQLTFKANAHPVYLRGLYKVILDLDEDPQLGDLNNGEIDLQIIDTSVSSTQPVELTFIFPDWSKADPALLKVNPSDIQPPFGTVTVASNFAIQIPFTVNLDTYTLNGEVSVGLQPTTGTITNTDIQNFFTNNNIATQQLVALYLSKIKKAHSSVQSAIRKLFKHRNLCEDFVSIETIKDEEIAFCFDVDVIPSADIEEVEANILFIIEKYLDPDVKFYLLSEMLQKINVVTGNIYTVDEIFEGPRLKHGFIDTKELEDTELVKEIHASEIISLIMNMQINNEKVILAVRNFSMTAYNDNGQINPDEASQQWCIKVDNWHKPILTRDKSKITLYKNGIPFTAGEKETDQTLQWLQSSHAREKLISTSGDISIPTGVYFPLETYTSVQQLFPQTYAVGDAALPSTATDERRGQARQLKAYLLFYDQLLADFLMQLKNAKALFSTDDIKQTYYAQFVSDFKDFDSIYTNGLSNPLIEENVIGTDPAHSAVVQDSTVKTPSPENDWEKLYETNETFIDRRNRFLDHLMARFAESFNEYVFLMYTLDTATQQATQIDPTDLIKSKIEFLKNYPRFSYDRAKGYNYCPLDKNFNVIATGLWNTDNVSGAEEKLCLLGGFKDDPPIAPAITGMPSYFRRNLYVLGKHSIIPDPTTDLVGPYRFMYTAGANQLTSVKTYNNTPDLVNDLPKFLTFLLAGEYYRIIIESAGPPKKYQVVVTDDNGVTLAQSGTYATKKAAKAAEQLFIDELNQESDIEGLHLVEHILLRPRDGTFLLAPVCLDDGCESCGEDDPYSFRISVVLPYWPLHMRSMAFRDYFEQIVRQEVPAHTVVKICWIDDESMFSFEAAYQNWITALANYKAGVADIISLQKANDCLVTILFNLHSEYPVATLHDCVESKDTNPVVLGKTKLGTIKKSSV